MINLYRALKELDFERLAGTDGEARGREVITRYLQEAGVPYEVQPFEIEGFDTGSARIQVGDAVFPAHPFGQERTAAIEGKLLFVENADILRYNRGAFNESIVLYYASSLSPDELLREYGARAIIRISPPHKGTLSLSHRQSFLRGDDKVGVAVTVSYSDAQRLITHSGKPARITIEQHQSTRTAHNIVATVGSPQRDHTLTYLVGHYDSVSRSHGAMDNAAGTVCLLKAAEYFTRKPPERELRIIFFSGEELGLLGSLAYTQEHEEEMHRRARLVINVDLAGDIIGDTGFRVLGTRELLGYVGGISREAGLLFSESVSIYSSDCMPFSRYEIPSVNIARAGGKAAHFAHTADDVGRHVSPRGLEPSYRAIVTILSRLLGAEIYPVKKQIDDNLREQIEQYLWKRIGIEPDLQWREKYKR